MIFPGVFCFFVFCFVFFIFSKFWSFWVASGVKGQKMVQNYKRFCLLGSMSQEPYIIWYLFMVRLCKMIIFQCFLFYFFQNVFFFVFSGVGQKMVQNDIKFCLSHSISQEPYIIWMSFVVHIFKTIISTDVFFFVFLFHFFKMLIFEVHRQGIMLKKIWPHQILAKPKTITAGGFGEGTQCLGEGWVWKLWTGCFG